MILHVQVEHRLGRITLDVTFTAGHGLTAVVGPSGAGKTSLLHAIAGLIRPTRGRIRLEETTLVDAEAGLFVPPHRRRIGYVTQDARLFPHLTVRQNLAYGRWFTPERARRVTFDAMVTLLDLQPLLGRRPSRLSGGELQRVSLGRALLTSPRLLLLDEPLAAVDVGRRQEILPYLDRLRRELTMPVVYVTHTLAEIAGRAETIVTLEEGRVMAVERPPATDGSAESPRSRGAIAP
jgi:molybdate transport system ATP-binding protein